MTASDEVSYPQEREQIREAMEDENERMAAENAAMRGLLVWVERMLANNNDYDDVQDWQEQYAAFLAAHPPT